MVFLDQVRLFPSSFIALWPLTVRQKLYEYQWVNKPRPEFILALRKATIDVLAMLFFFSSMACTRFCVTKLLSYLDIVWELTWHCQCLRSASLPWHWHKLFLQSECPSCDSGPAGIGHVQPPLRPCLCRQLPGESGTVTWNTLDTLQAGLLDQWHFNLTLDTSSSVFPGAFEECAKKKKETELRGGLWSPYMILVCGHWRRGSPVRKC